MDQRLEKMATVITAYSLEVKPGQLVLIQTGPAGFPLAREVYRQALRAGAHPYVRTHYPELDELLYREGNEGQVQFVSEVSRIEIEQVNARLTIRAPDNVKVLAGVDPARLALARRGQRGLFERMLARKGSGELRTCLTQHPTNASAQEAGMSLAEYEEFVFRACCVDRPDPIAAWRELSREQQRYVDQLDRVRSLKVETADTNLELSVAGRKWVNSDGKANFPSGEVFTGPVEDSARGRVRFDIPATYSGQTVEGVELEFDKGKVVKAKADRGERLLLGLLDTDEGARFLGEFAFGLNYNIAHPTLDILFDEKIGGTIHMAVGAGYPETGSTNRSGIHWDLIKDMRHGRVLADGELIYENGRFIR